MILELRKLRLENHKFQASSNGLHSKILFLTESFCSGHLSGHMSWWMVPLLQSSKWALVTHLLPQVHITDPALQKRRVSPSPMSCGQYVQKRDWNLCYTKSAGLSPSTQQLHPIPGTTGQWFGAHSLPWTAPPRHHGTHAAC